MLFDGFRATRTAVVMGPRVPDCVKTRTSRECAELFSLFSSFDGDCQNGSFVIRRSRDKLSTRKSEVEVFTQPCSRGRQKNVPGSHLHPDAGAAHGGDGGV